MKSARSSAAVGLAGMHAFTVSAPAIDVRRLARATARLRPVALLDASVGFLPVTLVAATAFGAPDLRALGTHVLLPALSVMVVVHCVVHDVAPRQFARVVGCGVCATLLYDCYRWGFIGLGLLPRDPIPHLGASLHLQPAWVFGYLWRYLGNGAGLALAFTALGGRGVRAGVAFGLFVCGGLLFVLVASPYGTAILFPVTPAAVGMAVGGHVIYGGVLGWMSTRRSVR